MENDVQHLIDLLYDMIDNAKGVPLGNDKCIIERNRAPGLSRRNPRPAARGAGRGKKLMAAGQNMWPMPKRSGKPAPAGAERRQLTSFPKAKRCRPPASRPMILSARRRSVPVKCTALPMNIRRTPSSARKMRCRPRWKKCARPTGSIRISSAAGCRKPSGVRVRRIPLLQKKSKEKNTTLLHPPFFINGGCFYVAKDQKCDKIKP